MTLNIKTAIFFVFSFIFHYLSSLFTTKETRPLYLALTNAVDAALYHHPALYCIIYPNGFYDHLYSTGGTRRIAGRTRKTRKTRNRTISFRPRIEIAFAALL
jgi:hypothetical protein